MKKTNPIILSKATGVLTAMTLVASSGALSADQDANYPASPDGWINAFPTFVQEGAHPQLSWSINYPAQVLEYVEIEEPGTIITKEDKMKIKIRVLGNGVTVHNSAGDFLGFVDAGAYVRFNNDNYFENIFFGSNLDVKPNKVVWKKNKNEVDVGTKLRFGGRFHYNGWGPFRHSTDGNLNVRTLVDGQTPPTTEPMHLAPTLEDFIRPYLDGSGKVDIGPMDVIVFMELTHSDSQQDDRGYDLQDMVLLVTFEPSKPKNNNGHGNNLDGVDSSNPGNAPFMQYDSDPNVDDEGNGGGAFPSN